MSKPDTGSRRGLERRRRRSDDTITALHYQLSLTRTEGRLDAVVLVDETGCLVAGAGAWPVCEELAAYAPLLAQPGLARSPELGSRVADVSRDVELRSLSVGGIQVLLCGRGKGPGAGQSLERAEAGCRRILCASA